MSVLVEECWSDASPEDQEVGEEAWVVVCQGDYVREDGSCTGKLARVPQPMSREAAKKLCSDHRGKMHGKTHCLPLRSAVTDAFSPHCYTCDSPLGADSEKADIPIWMGLDRGRDLEDQHMRRHPNHVCYPILSVRVEQESSNEDEDDEPEEG